jgi:hypothetical protein
MSKIFLCQSIELKQQGFYDSVVLKQMTEVFPKNISDLRDWIIDMVECLK